MKRIAIISRNREPLFKKENTIYLQITEKHTVDDLIKVAKRMQVDEIIIDNEINDKISNKIIKHAMIICVGNKKWDSPKYILMETDGKSGERLDDIAERAFEKYKGSQSDKDIYLVTYNSYSDIEIFDSK